METQQYQELIQLLRRLLEDQINSREKAIQDTITAQVEARLLLKEVESLRIQLTMKDELLAAKDETIGLLKAAFKNPN